MSALLALYWPTIATAALAAAALSVVGAFLVNRNAAVQSLAVSQGTGFGVAVGLLLSTVFFAGGHIEHSVLPLVLGVFGGAATFVVSDKIASRATSPTATYLAVFALLWAAAQLLTGLFPAVEAHASHLFFGDVVTLTTAEIWFFLALTLASGIWICLRWRHFARRAFLHSILGERVSLRRGADLGFYLVALLLLCFGVKLLGLLFTLGALFIPTAVLSHSRKAGVQRHLLLTAGTSFLAAGTGFCLSLAWERLLTTPGITVLFALIPGAFVLVERVLDASDLQLG